MFEETIADYRLHPQRVSLITHYPASIVSGARFPAAADSTVSSRYVPDLVETVLDLVIDGASGIRDVANDGATTWYEFARAAADLIERVETARVWGPAARPHVSAFSSCHGRLLRPLDAALDRYLEAARAARAATGPEACASR